MGPCHLQTRLFRIVRHVLVAVHRVLVRHHGISAEPIAFGIACFAAQSPRALGVDFAQYLEVYLVVDGQVVSSVAEIETACHLVAIGRHDDSRRIAFGKGEEAVGYGYGKRDILHDKIGRSEEGLLAGIDLSLCKFQVEVRMVGVAGGVFGIFHIEHAVVHALRAFALQETVALFRLHTGDESPLGFEVERHAFAFIRVVALLVYRATLDGAERVDCSYGMYERGVHVHDDGIGLKVHVLIVYLCLSEEQCVARSGLVDDGVLGGIGYRGVDTRFLGLASCSGVIVCRAVFGSGNVKGVSEDDGGVAACCQLAVQAVDACCQVSAGVRNGVGVRAGTAGCFFSGIFVLHCRCAVRCHSSVGVGSGGGGVQPQYAVGFPFRCRHSGR